MLDLPDTRQRDDFSCGAVALAIKFGYDKLPTTKWLKRLPNPVTGLGAEVVHAVVHAGYNGRVVHGTMDTPMLKYLTGRGRPVICLVTFDGCGHWVVCRGVERGKVGISCPTNGRQTMSIAEWDKAWVLSEGTPNEMLRYGVVGFPEE